MDSLCSQCFQKTLSTGTNCCDCKLSFILDAVTGFFLLLTFWANPTFLCSFIATDKTSTSRNSCLPSQHAFHQSFSTRPMICGAQCDLNQRILLLGTNFSLCQLHRGTSFIPLFTLGTIEQHIHYGWAVVRNSECITWQVISVDMLDVDLTGQGHQSALQLSISNKTPVISWTHWAILKPEEGCEKESFMKVNSEHYPIISMLFHNTDGFTFY